MNILKESKEQLPIDFITQFISSGWTEVGNIKASIKGIQETFKDTKKVEDILQELLDAYLICIGQLELYLKNKDYIDVADIKESLKEDVNTEPEAVAEISALIKDEVEAVDGYDKALDTVKDNTTGEVLKHIRDEEKEHINELSNTLNDKVDDEEAELVNKEIEAAEEAPGEIQLRGETEPFEYFTDFDEPELTEEDKALYNSSINMTIK